MRKEYYDTIIGNFSNNSSIFLAGPTPRSKDVKSWRPKALNLLEKFNYNGIVYIPEFNGGKNIFSKRTYIYEWEFNKLMSCSAILMWLPRSDILPGFTSNIEFGYYIKSGKFFFGHPESASKCAYMDWLYNKTTQKVSHLNLENLAKEVYNFVG